MAALSKDAAFWSRISRKYAASPIRNMDGYLNTLDRTKSYLKPSDRVLEMGCGTGSTALQIAPHVAHVTATDLAPGMIEIAREKLQRENLDNVSFQVAETQDHDQKAGSFDAVLAHNLLHLLPELDRSLESVHALTRAGGVFISKTVCAPDRKGIRYTAIRYVAIPLMQLLGKAPFVHFLTAHELEQTIEAKGFEILEAIEQDGMLPSRYIVARKVA